MGAAWAAVIIIVTRATIAHMKLISPNMDLYFPLAMGGGGLVVGVSARDILLGCGLAWLTSFFTGELRTDVELASVVAVLSWPDVAGEARPIVVLLMLDVGLDGGLFELHNSAVFTLALELIISGLAAPISRSMGVTMSLSTIFG